MAINFAANLVSQLHQVDDLSEGVVDDFTYDLFNLTACNYHAIRIQEEDKESNLLRGATVTTQKLIQRIFECPVEPTDVGPVAILPSEKFRLPREKRIPDAKPLTRWEKFAKEKGIKKKKRERMVYDDIQGEFRPRYGFKRANNGIEDMAIVEVKSGQDPMADPWSIARAEKKGRVLKNEKNQIQNKLRALGKVGKSTVSKTYDPKAVPGIPVDMSSKPKKRGKEGVRETLQLVQHSTASMGRFDEMRRGEPERKIKGKKRSFRDNFGGAENDLMKAQLRIVADKASKKLRGVTNSLAPYEGILPDAPSDAFKQKKGKGREKSQATPKKSKKNGKK